MHIIIIIIIIIIIMELIEAPLTALRRISGIVRQKTCEIMFQNRQPRLSELSQYWISHEVVEREIWEI